jgi:hypothetical protein
MSQRLFFKVSENRKKLELEIKNPKTGVVQYIPVQVNSNQTISPRSIFQASSRQNYSSHDKKPCDAGHEVLHSLVFGKHEF